MALGPYPGEGVPREPSSRAMQFINTQLQKLFAAINSGDVGGGLSAPDDTAVGDLFYWNGSALQPVPIGTPTKYVGNSSGVPVFERVDLAAGVTGNLPVSHLAGGSGASVGTFWRGDGTWAAAAGDGALVVVRTLTSAEINSLNTTPIDLVAAPGASAILVPLRALFWTTRTANAFSADPSFRLRYAGIATDLINAPSFFLTSASAGDTFRTLVVNDYNFGYGGSDPRNLALQISASADTTGGAGASVRVAVAYYLAEFSP